MNQFDELHRKRSEIFYWDIERYNEVIVKVCDVEWWSTPRQLTCLDPDNVLDGMFE